mmetsp:Transcript_7894/g.13311  ORF Transcript_7894/g.13311 Transcript_7894/m.13311 type:complete len:158 (+) Transcript_7894:2-475(+)
MPRDSRTASGMLANSQALQRLYSLYFDNNTQGASMITVKDCLPIPVTVEYLTSRLHYLNITSSDAEDIIFVLKAKGFIDNSDNFLLKDPTDRFNDWRSALQRDSRSKAVLQSREIVLTPGKSALAKALHRCWAFHEYCSDYLEDNIRWLNDFFEKTR